MINYTPQRSDFHNATYKLEYDILTVSVNDIVEKFDFSEFPDGVAEEITPELLPVNPIVSVKRENGELLITVIQLYGEAEKELYEVNHED